MHSHNCGLQTNKQCYRSPIKELVGVTGAFLLTGPAANAFLLVGAFLAPETHQHLPHLSYRKLTFECHMNLEKHFENKSN